MANAGQGTPPLDIEGRVYALLDASADRTTFHRRIDLLCAELPEHAASIRRVAGEIDAVAVRANAPQLPDVGARYHVIERIGRGGFGSVYRAEQLEPVRRQVALKVLHPGLDDPELLARFAGEQQALALLGHPAIATVLDAGRTSDGRPFFAMEYVPGPHIDEYCRRRGLDLGARIQLFLVVCDGLAHAHRRGLVHRDISHNNVLVTEVDDQPRVKIIDFGLVKSLRGALIRSAIATSHGATFGTPEFMSPEQAAGASLDAPVDQRTDVYALGALLYLLLTDSLPIPSARVRGQSPNSTAHAIRTFEVELPSRRLRSRSEGESRLVASAGCLRGDLDSIVMQAMAKDPSRRYHDAAALAADVRRHLAGEPIVARRPSMTHRLWRWVTRRRGTVAMTATVMIAAVAIGGWWSHRGADAFGTFVVGVYRDCAAGDLAAAANRTRARLASLSPGSDDHAVLQRVLRGIEDELALADAQRRFPVRGPAAPDTPVTSLAPARTTRGEDPAWSSAARRAAIERALVGTDLRVAQAAVPPSVDVVPTLRLAGRLLNLDQFDAAERLLLDVPEGQHGDLRFGLLEALLLVRRAALDPLQTEDQRVAILDAVDHTLQELLVRAEANTLPAVPPARILHARAEVLRALGEHTAADELLRTAREHPSATPEFRAFLDRR